MNHRNLFALMLAVVMGISLPAGFGLAEGEITTVQAGVIRNEEFGHIYIDPTIEEFNALGFSFGDSVSLVFSNGKRCDDIPYYSGYYCAAGELLVCGYPGYPHVIIARNYSSSTWEEFEMTDSSSVTVTLYEKGKYLGVQDLYSLSYSSIREEFTSDEEFSNFREVRGGNLRPGAVYRAASPCNNQYRRAACTDRLTEKNGIRFVLNLSDNEEKYKAHTEADDFDSPYYDSLCRDGKVLLLAMNANYRSEAFAEVLSGALLAMTGQEGPVLIHCVEGKDRTGFACALLLALSDASPQEIIDDYMITFTNYFGITKDGDPKRYEAIRGNVLDFMYCMCGAEKGTDPETLNLKAGAENYLRMGGLTDEQIAQIESFLTAEEAALEPAA